MQKVSRKGAKIVVIFSALCVLVPGREIFSALLVLTMILLSTDEVRAERQMENLGRGVVALAQSDGKTGKALWTKPSPDVGRGVAFDIDPRHPGHEIWAAGPGLGALYDCQGNDIGPKPRSCNMAVWWDGDLLRELLSGTTITKWDFENGRDVPILSAGDFGCASNNSTKANPCLCADILGDWREEVIWRTHDSRELRIFTTTIPTAHRLPTLMHDPQYHLGIAWQNVGYNQPAHTSYFFGDGMKPPPRSGGFPTTDPPAPPSGTHPGGAE